MEPANHAFFELLKFPAAQLFRVKSQEILLVHHGAFQILHNDSIDLFLLKLGHLKIALNKNLPVVGAFSDEQKYPAYLLPTFDGFYMIKIMDNTPSIALSNFETILENTCQFSRREGMEKKLGDIREPTIDTKMLVLSEMYHKAKDIIALHILPQDHHANFTLLRTFEDIQNVYGHAVEVVDVSSGEIESAKNEVEEVIRNHLSNRYWRHFSQHEGTPAGSHLGLSAFKSRISDQSEQSRLLGEERDRSESIGAANICNVKKEQEIDLQEVVGTENQRLPAYEVQNTKEHVEQGLDQASCRLDDAKFYQSCDLPPVPESQVKEDTNFTTDLLKPDEQKGLGEPLSNFDKGGDVYSQPLDSSVKDQFPTELQPRPESNMFQTLENATGDLYRRDFVQEMSLNRPPGSEKWGSDVTNPSEKMGSELGFSDAGFSATSENNGSESLGTKPVLFTGGLTHSQSLRDTSLTGNVMKENLAFKQVPSDKVEMKQKNVSEKPIEKENLTSANVV